MGTYLVICYKGVIMEVETLEMHIIEQWFPTFFHHDPFFDNF